MAAPAFHDERMPVPDVDEHGIPMLPDETTSETTVFGPPGNEDTLGVNGWSAWRQDSNQLYEIERVISAERKGSGWSLMIKWKGYPDPTPEPLSTVLKQTNHPEVLADIERCKKDYYALHPQADPNSEDSEDVQPVNAKPTRVLPARERTRTQHFSFLIKASNRRCSKLGIGALSSTQRRMRARHCAVSLFLADRMDGSTC